MNYDESNFPSNALEAVLNAANERDITFVSVLEDDGITPMLWYDDRVVYISRYMNSTYCGDRLARRLLHEVAHYDVAKKYGLEGDRDFGISVYDDLSTKEASLMEIEAQELEESIINAHGYMTDPRNRNWFNEVPNFLSK